MALTYMYNILTVPSADVCAMYDAMIKLSTYYIGLICVNHVNGTYTQILSCMLDVPSPYVCTM